MGTYGSFAYLILMLLDVLSTITLSSWRCKIKLGLFACSLGSSARREERIEKPAWQLLHFGCSCIEKACVEEIFY